jgi:hypothetical protein
MSPKNEHEAPRRGAKSAALIALAAALAGGTGGVVISPRMAAADTLTRQELSDALGPIVAKLEAIEMRVTALGEEAAVARYEREHR